MLGWGVMLPPQQQQQSKTQSRSTGTSTWKVIKRGRESPPPHCPLDSDHGSHTGLAAALRGPLAWQGPLRRINRLSEWSGCARCPGADVLPRSASLRRGTLTRRAQGQRCMPDSHWTSLMKFNVWISRVRSRHCRVNAKRPHALNGMLVLSYTAALWMVPFGDLDLALNCVAAIDWMVRWGAIVTSPKTPMVGFTVSMISRFRFDMKCIYVSGNRGGNDWCLSATAEKPTRLGC